MTEILKPTRRGLLRGAAALGATGAIASPLVLREAHAQAAFNWKRFSGQSIDVLLVKNPRSPASRSPPSRCRSSSSARRR
jgi:multiple sugar transport system substrate-binding protein